MIRPTPHEKFRHPELLAQASSDDSREWVPAAMPGVWMRPLLFDTVSGAWVNVTRIRAEGKTSRHRHACPVHAYVLSGQWRYRERDWIASAGQYLLEPAGDIHTLIGLPGGSETLFWIAGSLCELDDDGTIIACADVFSRIDQAAAHFEAAGLGRDYVRRFIR
jgi:quercetin dioxygenase-like cupin family protein